ncbi:hypothetical protein LG302_02600 [Halomonas organivorans]
MRVMDYAEKAIKEKPREFLIFKRLLIAVSPFLGYFFYGLVSIKGGSAIILGGGLVAAALSYLNIEMNKGAKEKEVKEKRCEKIESMVAECFDEYLGVILPAEKLHDQINVLQVKRHSVENRYFYLGEKYGVVRLEDCDTGFLDELKLQENISEDNYQEVNRLFSSLGEKVDVMTEMRRKEMEVKELHVNLLRKLNMIRDYSETTGEIFTDIKDIMEDLSGNLKSLENTGHDRLKKTEEFDTDGEWTGMREDPDLDDELARAMGNIDVVISDEISKVYKRLDKSSLRYKACSEVSIAFVIMVTLFVIGYNVAEVSNVGAFEDKWMLFWLV